MTITLEMKRAIEHAGREPVRLSDPETGVAYYLVNVEEYDRLKNGHDDGPEMKAAQEVIRGNHGANLWHQKLDQMEHLEVGWNGYAAPPPSGDAIVAARGFLTQLLDEKFEPSRIAPSAVGGVGITHKTMKRRVYVEFFNDSEACALFSDNESAPRSKRFAIGDDEFKTLIEEIRVYLDA